MNRHLDRPRAESFGAVAAQYDRYRPSFPAELIDELAARRPERVLDVGTGTGKVAVTLAHRGLDVLGVEVDPRMAEVAQQKGARVEVARFEDWDDAGRRFDLVTCGDAWHWIEPEAGFAKVSKVLRPGGTLARFFNSMALDEDVLAVLDEVYRAHAPGTFVYGQAPPESAGADWLTLSGSAADAFTSIEHRTYRREQLLEVEEWVQYLGTISDHQRLGEEKLATLQDAVRERLRAITSQLRVHGRTFAAFTRRA